MKISLGELSEGTNRGQTTVFSLSMVVEQFKRLWPNEAERLLRHWVILRRISQGARTEQGSRALALLASVIETCRKRDVLPWPYLASVIAERRKGNPAPPLPAAMA